MAKKTIRDVDLSGQRVLVRVDFNVPREEGTITDDTRIQAALPTINNLRSQGAVVILCAHLGRPKGERVSEESLQLVAARLAELVGAPVVFVEDCIGEPVVAAVEAASPGDILLLENTRFYPGEESKDEAEMLAFAEQLAAPAQAYVNDAFGACHRKHASTYGVTNYLSPCVAGLLVEDEVDKLSRLLQADREGFVAILGGAKVEDKIGVVEVLLPRVEYLLIGGAMAWAFFKAQGMEIGEALVTEKSVAGADDIWETMSDYVARMSLAVDGHMRASQSGVAK